MNEELPPFSEEATCPKCGSEDVRAKAVLDGTKMARDCDNCGWQWFELPLDASDDWNEDLDDESDEDGDEDDEPEGCGCCTNEAPKPEPAKDDLTMAREASKLLYAGNGFELRTVPDSAVTPELLAMVTRSKVVVGIPSNLL